MPVDEETRRKIVKLYLNEHKTIRDISKLSKKSSRDIIAVLRNTAHEGKEEVNDKTCGNDARDLDQGNGDTAQECNHFPLNTKGYILFSEGKSLLEVALKLKLSEEDAAKYYMEYLRLVRLLGLSLTFKELGSARGVSYFSKLSNIATAEQLTVEEVIHLLWIVKNNPLWYVEARIEEVKRMLFFLESELEERKDELFHYNEKIEQAKLILNGWEKARKELREEVRRIYDEKQTIQNLVY